MFAVIATTEYYGPETRVALAGLHDTRIEADEAAQSRPDYDASVGCARLDHNQAVETRLSIGEAVPWDGSVFDLLGMDGIEEVKIRAMKSGIDIDDADSCESLACEVLAEAGTYILADPEAPGRLWLVEKIA
jgi:hypothetical protein